MAAAAQGAGRGPRARSAARPARPPDRCPPPTPPARPDASAARGHHRGGGGAYWRWAWSPSAGWPRAEFLSHLTVFALACVVGWQVVWNVTPALHTPLMSVTNAISGIIVVGGMLQVSGPPWARR